jgi:hypothetical protein
MLVFGPLLIAGSLLAAWDHAYRVAPGMAIACALALAIPVLAAGAWLTRSVMTGIARRAHRRAPISSAPNEMIPATAWVRPDGASPFELKTSKTLIVVGRDLDADLVLDDNTVAAHHAAIERTPDNEYWIVDLTGPEGPGVSVNNHRVARLRLTGGERITLGAQRLTFESRLH